MQRRPADPMRAVQEEQRAELRALYTRTDALLAPHSCEASAECCDFSTFGREPYPTAIERDELDRAVRARGGPSKSRAKRALPIVRHESEKGKRPRVCALLGEDRRCTVYEARPFGCRTFFCDRRIGPKKMPREELAEIGRAIADLSARFMPRDPGPRPLSRIYPTRDD